MKSNYTFGTHRTFSLLNALSTADTDGLGFATLNSTCSFSGETWEQFVNAYGGLTDGANTSVKKGIRHYVVTFKDGENTLSTQEVSSGNKATKPADPTKVGYTFVKWQSNGVIMISIVLLIVTSH
jgi:hypothetical protein